MTGRRRSATMAALGAAVCLSLPACSSSDDSTPAIGPEPTSEAPSTTTSSEASADIFTVDGLVLHLVCRGTGTPVVVLLAGGRDSGSDWDGLVDDLGPDTRTCAFDYPGAGDSPAIDQPMTPAIVTETLEGALAAAGEAPPYVLVGHSLAGLSVRVFVGTHPEQVAGVVLFDGTPVETVKQNAVELEEALDWDARATIDQAAAVTSWPDVPVRVFESDPAVEARTGRNKRIWHQGQLALAALAPHGRYRLATGTSHFIFQDDPELAMRAVRGVLAEVG